MKRRVKKTDIDGTSAHQKFAWKTMRVDLERRVSIGHGGVRSAERCDSVFAAIKERKRDRGKERRREKKRANGRGILFPIVARMSRQIGVEFSRLLRAV